MRQQTVREIILDSYLAPVFKGVPGQRITEPFDFQSLQVQRKCHDCCWETLKATNFLDHDSLRNLFVVCQVKGILLATEIRFRLCMVQFDARPES